MNRILDDIAVEATKPTPTDVLAAQGIPPERVDDPRTRDLAEESIARYSDLARPFGLLQELAVAEFASIYEGEGDNAPHTPLENILPATTACCLFVVTVGSDLTDEIRRRFDSNNFAAGAMLDAAASGGAELTAAFVERHWSDSLRAAGALGNKQAVMRFSPGYCGWNVSGQKKLFARMKPDAIGVTLSDSCLMHPLKSISGVIVAAPFEYFDIDDTYPFCADCATHSCRDRWEATVNEYSNQKTGS